MRLAVILLALLTGCQDKPPSLGCPHGAPYWCSD